MLDFARPFYIRWVTISQLGFSSTLPTRIYFEDLPAISPGEQIKTAHNTIFKNNYHSIASNSTDLATKITEIQK